MGSDRNEDSRRWLDDVATYPADAQVLAGYDRARQQLAEFQTPQLGGPNGRVFVACFDGTWNDKEKFPDGKTNVAEIYDQIFRADNKNVAAGYQSGVGTQDDWLVQKVDGALGYSYGPRMEKMYLDFIKQAAIWRDENPNAEISIASVGFSRGGVTASMFTRMVHERGIQNPDGMVIDRDPQGNIRSLTPTKPALVPPGKTAQVLGLFDPVATGEMNLADTRPAPSVVSGFQITALHERRDLFLSKQIIDPGLSPDGRFFAAQVAAAHSDIGGGYLLNGLSVRNGNMMMAYLNGTFGEPVLRERVVPTAPEMNVIHRSEQGQAFYSTAAADLLGERMATERLAAPARTPVGMVYDHLTKNMDDAEPVDNQLRASLRYRPIPVGPQREDPSVPEFYREYQIRMAAFAPAATWNPNSASPAEPQIFRDSGARSGYDVREQLQREAPYLTPKPMGEPPAPTSTPTAPLPGIGAPLGERPQMQAPVAPAHGWEPPALTPTPSAPLPGIGAPLGERPQMQAPVVPTLDPVIVRPGPELTQGPSAPLPGIGAPWNESSLPQAPTSQPDDSARQVATLQTGLIQLGYHQRISQPLQVNGSFDDATKQAVTAFQAQANLPITSSFDLATQQALQQALLAQQQMAEQRQTEDKTREDERKTEQERKAEQTQGDERMRPFSDPDHPQHKLYADLDQRFQAKGHALSEEQLSVLTAQMDGIGFKTGWQGDVTVRNGVSYIGTGLPGMHAHLNLETPAPAVEKTMQDFADQQQYAQEVARNLSGPDGPSQGGPRPSM